MSEGESIPPRCHAHSERILLLEHDMGAVKQDLGDIKSAVCGNGKPSMNDRIRNVEARIGGARWVVQVAVQATITALVATGVAALIVALSN